MYKLSIWSFLFQLLLLNWNKWNKKLVHNFLRVSDGNKFVTFGQAGEAGHKLELGQILFLKATQPQSFSGFLCWKCLFYCGSLHLESCFVKD